MQYPPIEVLATFPVPNYNDPVTRGSGLLICHVVLFPTCMVLIAIRMYTRIRISSNLGLDDLFIFLAFLMAATFLCLSAYVQGTFGSLRHVWDIELLHIPTLLKIYLTTQVVFGTAVTFVKISMLLLTRKIMGTHSKMLQHVIYAVLAFVVAGNIAYTLVLIFQCKPMSDYWTMSFTPQQCINQQSHLLAAGIQNIITDLLVVLLPIPVVLRLNMRSRRQRMTVVFLFGIGFCVCIVGIVRTIYLYRLEDSYDYTWDLYPVYITGAIELYVGIICASVPPTKAFITRYAPKVFAVTTSQFTGNSSNHRSRHIEKSIQLSGITSTASSSMNNPPTVPPKNDMTIMVTKRVQVEASPREGHHPKIPSMDLEHGHGYSGYLERIDSEEDLMYEGRLR